jgi:hypothetical protein
MAHIDDRSWQNSDVKFSRVGVIKKDVGRSIHREDE